MSDDATSVQPYEYHFTFDVIGKEQRVAWEKSCQSIDWKPLVIDNFYKGEHVSRHYMASLRMSEIDWHGRMVLAISSFSSMHWFPNRVKVETMVKKLLLPGEYYETHMKIKTGTAPRMAKECVGFSHNVAKEINEFLVTYRSYRDAPFHRSVAIDLAHKFLDHGVPVIETEEEHCILDTNVGMDDDWLKNVR